MQLWWLGLWTIVLLGAACGGGTDTEPPPTGADGGAGAGASGGSGPATTGAGANAVCGDGIVNRPSPSCRDCAVSTCDNAYFNCVGDTECQPLSTCLSHCNESCVDTCADAASGQRAGLLMECLQNNCGEACTAYHEACDGDDLDGKDCTDFGFADPSGLACDACALDSSGCTPVCGNAVVEPNEECDAPNTAICQSCMRTGDSCTAPATVAVDVGRQVLSGTTAGAPAAVAVPEWDGSNCGGDLVKIHAVTANETGVMTAALDVPAPSMNAPQKSLNLWVLSNCDGAMATIACTGRFGTGEYGSAISWWAAMGTTYYVYVASHDYEPLAQPYTLTFDLSFGTCSDPAWLPIWQSSHAVITGDTSQGSVDHDHTCTMAAAPEIVYEVDARNAGLNFFPNDVLSGFAEVMATRTTCDQQATEVGCGLGSLTLNPTQGTPLYFFIDGDGESGAYVFYSDAN